MPDCSTASPVDKRKGNVSILSWKKWEGGSDEKMALLCQSVTWLLTMIIALHGYTPTATRNVPPYRTWARLATRSIIYPAMASTFPAAIIGPLALILSDSNDVNKTVKNAAKFGGTVKSCAVVGLVYPRPVMMVGRKREKLCLVYQH